MAPEPGGRELSGSPLNSGRASPIVRPTRRQADDENSRPDKNFRRYASNIERALALFDSALQEWADYISFLGRLLKAIQSHPPAQDLLPHSAEVSKRLSQCLSPSLPSGVHQKAIEVYSYVFSLIGKQRLSQDLPIFLPGLTPVLSFASLSVRPYFLALVETHIVPLEASALRPALRSILLGLLPGLEEETSEDFERTLRIFDNLKIALNPLSHAHGEATDVAGDEYFWQCMFLAVVASPSRRLGALNFLMRRLPRLSKSLDHGVSSNGDRDTLAQELPFEVETVISPEPGLLIRCFEVGLSDAQLLVQRGFLDLLVSRLPLNSPVLSERADPADRQRLIAAATGVVARRDMSLNRRLWSWFLGMSSIPSMADDRELASPSEESNDPFVRQKSLGSAYFEQYGAQSLIQAMLNLFRRPEATSLSKARPYRLCLSLMDRADIGAAISAKLFLPAVESLASYKREATEEEFAEVIRSASGLFDAVESYLIWGELQKLTLEAIETTSMPNSTRLQKLNLVLFTISTFNIRDEEMVSFHIPLVLTTILIAFNNAEQASASNGIEISSEVISKALSIAEHLSSLLPSRVFRNNSAKASVDFVSDERILATIRSYYTLQNGQANNQKMPLSIMEIAAPMVRNCSDIFKRTLHFQTTQSGTAILRSRLLVTVMLLSGVSEQASSVELFAAIEIALKSRQLDETTSPMPFATLNAIVQVLVQMPRSSSASVHVLSCDIITRLVTVLWTFLSPSSPRHHVEAVRLLWQLHELTLADGLIEAAISSFVVGAPGKVLDIAERIESARRFSVLWTHSASLAPPSGRKSAPIVQRSVSLMSEHSRSSELREVRAVLHRPLLLLLDALSESHSELQIFTRDWLRALPEVDSILDFLLRKVREEAVSDVKLTVEEGTLAFDIQNANLDSTREKLNYLQHILTLVMVSSNNIQLALSREITVEGENEVQVKQIRAILAEVCLKIITDQKLHGDLSQRRIDCEVLETAASIVRLLLQSSESGALRLLSYEDRFIELLRASVKAPVPTPTLQVIYMEIILAGIDLKAKSPYPGTMGHRRTPSTDAMKSLSRLTINSEANSSQDSLKPQPFVPSPQLVLCIQEGLSSLTSHSIIENWISFLTDILPYLSGILFRILIPLVECVCSNIGRILEILQGTFASTTSDSDPAPERVAYALLTGLDVILSTAHERLEIEESKGAVIKTPDQPQGFFGNVVSGVFSSEFPKGRSATANTRLTVLLSFQDAIQKCLALCAWGSRREREKHQDATSAASLSYLSQRLRAKARRQLDRLFAAEPLESLEMFVVQWSETTYSNNATAPSVTMRILHILESTKPKVIISAIFHAIYSRTNPEALNPGRMSTLTADLTDVDLVTFLVEYTRSLDDDTMDEIWTDCMTFMKDVLANPLPHRQILPGLLMFVPLLAEKVENTNFGDQRKLRKDLADFFMRLLTAAFTTKSLGSVSHPSHDGVGKAEESASDTELPEAALRRMLRSTDVTDVLTGLLPTLSLTLTENDRLFSAASAISINLISPPIHTRAFPEGIRPGTLDLLSNMCRIPAASKLWKKDVSDALGNSKFFSTPVALVERNWLPILRQWTLGDSGRISDFVSRIVAPTSAGIMFGVGATSARLEADKKTQLNLRRLSVLILASDEDWAVPQLSALEDKIIELLSATPTSSPSSLTRAEIFILIRALVLKTSSLHLSSLWPIINTELQKAISSTLPRDAHYETYQTHSLLQACKLLDLLIALAPDEFQLHQWLFITDTIDAVYHPEHWEPVALVDDLAEELGLREAAPSPRVFTPGTATFGPTNARQGPLLLNVSEEVATTSKQEIVQRVLRPFFAQLSSHAFEALYSMSSTDRDSCKVSLIRDLFNDTTFVS